MKELLTMARWFTKEKNTPTSLNSEPPIQMCQPKYSWVTHLRVPFSPLSRLVKRLYRRVIWLWETAGKKKEDDKLACQWFLIGADLITLNCAVARSCVQKRVHTEPVTLKAQDNEHLGTLWAINHSSIFRNLQISLFFKILSNSVLYPFLLLIFNNFWLSESVNVN